MLHIADTMSTSVSFRGGKWDGKGIGVESNEEEVVDGPVNSLQTLVKVLASE